MVYTLGVDDFHGHVVGVVIVVVFTFNVFKLKTLKVKTTTRT